jgi:hypothetical protein
MLPPFLTVSEAFGIQRLLGTHQSAAVPIAIAFSPDLGKSLKQPDEAPGEELRLPIRVSGLPPDSFVGIDRAEVRLIDSNGAILYRGSAKLKPAQGGNLKFLRGRNQPAQEKWAPINKFRCLRGSSMRLAVKWSAWKLTIS